MSVTVETGTARSNSWDQNQQIWMSHLCLGSEYCFMVFLFLFFFFFSRSKWKRNDNSIWLWPRAMTFVKSIVIECCVFLLAMTERSVVLIHRPHAVKLCWHCASDKPLLSSVCASDGRKQAEGTARRRSSWTATARLQGLASACYTWRCRLYVAKRAEREWLCQFDL